MSEIDYSSKTDEELMIAYQEGDSMAFNLLYDRNADLVRGYLRKRISDSALADDIFQGTFFKFHLTRMQYRTPLPLLPWLFTICRSVMIDALRSKGRESKKTIEISKTTVTSVQAEQHNLEPVLLEDTARLKILSEEQKQALLLRYGNDFSFEEIALRLETTPVNARQMVSRALKKVKMHGQKLRAKK